MPRAALALPPARAAATGSQRGRSNRISEPFRPAVAVRSAARTSSPTRTPICDEFLTPRPFRLTGIISRFCLTWTSATVIRAIWLNRAPVAASIDNKAAKVAFPAALGVDFPSRRNDRAHVGVGQDLRLARDGGRGIDGRQTVFDRVPHSRRQLRLGAPRRSVEGRLEVVHSALRRARSHIQAFAPLCEVACCQGRKRLGGELFVGVQNMLAQPRAGVALQSDVAVILRLAPLARLEVVVNRARAP